MKKILVFIGTRPEAIKLAPLVFTLRERADEFSTTVCSTSQHGSMLQQAFYWFNITPDEDLHIIKENQHTGDVVAAVLAGANNIVRHRRPDIIVVQGDTATATAGALAGFYADIPVAHVEAGLRSGDRRAPWPEETNRLLISKLATHHFAVTKKNAITLRAENVDGNIHTVGNTVLDALLYMQHKINTDAATAVTVRDTVATAGYRVAEDKPFILVTGHRRESFGNGMKNICSALKTIAEQHPQIDIVYAVHLNPNVCDIVHAMLDGVSNIYLLPPFDYAAFVYLMSHCKLILTDSGGIQEEAPTLNKPVLIMRDVTERPEVVECGAAKLVGTTAKNIIIAANQVLTDSHCYNAMAAAKNPFGDGKAAKYIADILAE